MNTNINQVIQTYTVGQQVSFIYHGKPRIGTVDAVKSKTLVLRLPGEKATFKAFKYHKINNS
jgi:ferredoxin-fold anticodon binding domain-containing protein